MSKLCFKFTEEMVPKILSYLSPPNTMLQSKDMDLLTGEERSHELCKYNNYAKMTHTVVCPNLLDAMLLYRCLTSCMLCMNLALLVYRALAFGRNRILACQL